MECVNKGKPKIDVQGIFFGKARIYRIENETDGKHIMKEKKDEQERMILMQ